MIAGVLDHVVAAVFLQPAAFLFELWRLILDGIGDALEEQQAFEGAAAFRRDVMTTDWPFLTALSKEGNARRICRTDAVFMVKHVRYTNATVKPAPVSLSLLFECRRRSARRSEPLPFVGGDFPGEQRLHLPHQHPQLSD